LAITQLRAKQLSKTGRQWTKRYCAGAGLFGLCIKAGSSSKQTTTARITNRIFAQIEALKNRRAPKTLRRFSRSGLQDSKTDPGA
jgi:hypothetical protein